MRLYKQIMKRYAKGQDASNVYYYYGMAVAYTMVDTLRHAGRNLTRKTLLRAGDAPEREEPVHAARHPDPDLADGLLPDREDAPVPLPPRALGRIRAAHERARLTSRNSWNGLAS